MTVKLVKREQSVPANVKQKQPPSRDQIIVTTQGWVEEFRSRKARTDQSLLTMI
jgi:hypothetical protein